MTKLRLWVFSASIVKEIFFIPKTVISGEVIRGEAPYDQWGEIARIAAATEGLRSVAGLVLFQEPQGWDWGEGAFNGKDVVSNCFPRF